MMALVPQDMPTRTVQWASTDLACSPGELRVGHAALPNKPLAAPVKKHEEVMLWVRPGCTVKKRAASMSTVQE